MTYPLHPYRRIAFLAFWLGLTFVLAWFPPVNRAVYGDAPSRWTYDGPYTSIARTALPTASAFATRRPTDDPHRASTAPVASASVSGTPTWYCLAGVSRCTKGHPDGPGIDLYAAAGPSIRRAIPDWRGRTVTVCAKVCIEVTLIDWCACGGDHFLDLYHDAWVLLGRPGRATVTW